MTSSSLVAPAHRGRGGRKRVGHRWQQVRCVLALYVGLLVFYAQSSPPVHLVVASVAMVAGLWLWSEHLGRRLGEVLVAHARSLSHEQAVALVDRRAVSVTRVLERFGD